MNSIIAPNYNGQELPGHFARLRGYDWKMNLGQHASFICVFFVDSAMDGKWGKRRRANVESTITKDDFVGHHYMLLGVTLE